MEVPEPIGRSAPTHTLSLARRVGDKGPKIQAALETIAGSNKMQFKGETLGTRRWSVLPPSTSLIKRIKIQLFAILGRIFPFLYRERRTDEAKLKTFAALFMANRELGLQKEQLVAALNEVKRELGINAELGDDPTSLRIDGRDVDLTAEPEELAFQLALLGESTRRLFSHHLASALPRDTIRSALTHKETGVRIDFRTDYARFHVTKDQGEIFWEGERARGTTAIRIPGASLETTGTACQRSVVGTDGGPMQYYCGQMPTQKNVLGQILFILETAQGVEPGGDYELVDHAPEELQHKDICFDSLLAYNENDDILQKQAQAIRDLDGRVLKRINPDKSVTYIKLHLHHRNIPWGWCNRFGIPESIRDNFNKDANFRLGCLVGKRFFKEDSKELGQFVNLLQRGMIDEAKQMLPEPSLLKDIYPACVTRRDPNGKPLSQTDHYIYGSLLTRLLGIAHNVNCKSGIDRTGAADALDKAQGAFYRITGKYFLPGEMSPENEQLFNQLYTLYITWEEPELTTGFATGFIGEKFQSNPEALARLVPLDDESRKYLLGLSGLRTS